MVGTASHGGEPRWQVQLAVAACLVLAPAGAGADAMVGSLDDFLLGTHNWEGHTEVTQQCLSCGFPPDPCGCTISITLESVSNPAQGGPNDPLPNPYLRVSDLPSTSLGLVTWNTADDHTGDYLAAGIGRVELDLKNFGPGDLKVRVGIERGTTQWVTSDAAAITLLAASGWQLGRRFFLTSSSDQMTRVTGSDSLEFVLQDVEEIRLLHSQTAKWSEDDAPDGALGIDNVLLPEPGDRGSMMCGTALLALLACRRRNRNTPPA